MRVDDDTAEEFKRLYERVRGKTLSIGEAHEMARRLLTLYEVLLSPLSNKRGSGAVQDVQDDCSTDIG